MTGPTAKRAGERTRHRPDGGSGDERRDHLALATVFGLASVPWTYAFVAVLQLPLWPSFVASAAFYATDEEGIAALSRALAGTLVGVAYALATLLLVERLLGGDVIALSLVVGVFMFLASLHGLVATLHDVLAPLSFTPGAFLGYASLFGVHAAGPTVLGIGGIAGAGVATALAMSLGAVIGLATDEGRRWLRAAVA